MPDMGESDSSRRLEGLLMSYLIQNARIHTDPGCPEMVWMVRKNE